MKYILSILERKSFVKILIVLFLSFISLTGFVSSQHKQEFEDNNVLFFEETNIENINIFPPKMITLMYGDEKFDLLTYEENVKDLLEFYNIEHSEHDIILPSLSYIVKDKSLVKVILVEKDLFVIEEDIPYTVKRIENSSMRQGEEVIKQEGSLGIKTITYEEIYENNQLVDKQVYKIETTKQPVDKIIHFGTKTTAIGGRNCPHWFGVIEEATDNEWEREVLKSLIKCESNCNDSKNNSNLYLGLLQFSRNTFYHYGGEDIWDGQQQILAAINILRAGGLSHHWPACARNIN